MQSARRRIAISAEIEHWPFTRPFHITGHVFDGVDVLVVTAESDGLRGRGEAAGVYYHGETVPEMACQIERMAGDLATASRTDLLELLPAGGARNALDCALWDLEAKQLGQPVWKLAGLAAPSPLLTTFTIGAGDPGPMAELARSYANARSLKLKLTGDGADAERVQAVRAARPDAWIGIDANQGFTPDSFHALLPTLLAARVALVEQPFPLDRNQDLDGLNSPIPIAADESVQDRHDIAAVAGRVQIINIKLDKSGGLTEALAMAAEARRLGLKLMVGNMLGTSLSTAPGFVFGQLCDFADLDGPIFLARDRVAAVHYADGKVFCPDDIWGSPAPSSNQAVSR